VTYVIAIKVDIPMYRILNYRRRVMCSCSREMAWRIDTLLTCCHTCINQVG